MTAPDVRTAAQAEADKHWPRPLKIYTESTDFEYEAFVTGAVWGAARVTPTREQIARVLDEDRYYDPDQISNLERADAILALMNSPK